MIYVIGERRSGVVKIGWAVQPERRLKSIQTGNPTPLRVLGAFVEERAAEGELHATFQARRLSGEWFDFTGTDSVHCVSEALNGAHARLGAMRRDGRQRRRAERDAAVLKLLAKTASSDGLVAGTHDAIGRAVGIEPTSAGVSIKRLVEAELVKVTRVGTGRYPTVYQLLNPQGALDLEWAEPPAAVRQSRARVIYPWEPDSPWVDPERRAQLWPSRADKSHPEGATP